MPSEPDRSAALLAEAQDVLGDAWAYPVQLRMQDVIRTWARHTLLRCRVKDRPPDAPDFAVVKATNGAGGDMRHERAGLALLAEIPAVRDRVPALYAGNDTSTLLVIEDVGAGPTLSRLLRSKQSWAREALVESMAGLAAMHGITRGAHERYEALRARLGTGVGGSPGPVGANRLATGLPQLSEVLAAAYAALGWETADLPIDELREISERMEPPASLRCLTFDDQCPPNRIVVDGRLWFVDLEMVRFRHPFLDGAYPLIGHFRCMDCQRFPDGLAAAMLYAYRSGLAPAHSELTDDDDRFAAELASACAVWLVTLLRGLPDALARDRVVGFQLASSRQRLLAVLDAFVAATSPAGRLPRLTGTCRRIRELLADRWVDTEPLPYFPVFATDPEPAR